jgi:hypothetical protein
MRAGLLTCACGITFAIVAGCHEPQWDPAEPSQPASAECRGDWDSLWAASQEVLRARGFAIDRLDVRNGRIVTEPLPAPHFFEFWRRDWVSGSDVWESTVLPLRRRVEVTIRPTPVEQANAANEKDHELQIVVAKERFTSPDRQFNSSAAAYHFFSDELPAARTGAPIRPEDSAWVPMGRDPALERHLLDAVLAEAGRSHSESD